MSDAKPPHQRPELPDFWDHRFRSGVTPWDAGVVPSAFRDYIDRQTPAGILIPGCGSAHEAHHLDHLGWQVVALDFAAAAIDLARRNLGDWGGTLLQEDFFAHCPPQPYDVVYERAFLCALPRKLWSGYGEATARLLAPGGILAGYFYFGDDPKGPPFAIRPDDLMALLGPFFTLEVDLPALDSIPVFAGKERWMVWRRKST
jgi:SAM-dependent methyltransferase